MTNSLLNNIQNMVEAGTLGDQTVTQTKFVRQIAPEGVTTARLVGYVELGYLPQRPWQGEEKPDAPMVTLTWELNGKAYMKNIAKAGEPENLVPTMHRETIKLSTNERAKYFKLFNKMRRQDKPVKHMAQLLGEGCIIRIKHNASKKDPSIKYANIYTAVDGWMVTPPIETSAVSGETTEVPVPPAVTPMQLLLQSNPSIPQWNSIYIDGTYTKKINGADVTLSKNFVQYKLLGASSFSGSPLESLLKDNNLLAGLLADKNISDSAYNDSKPRTETVEVPVVPSIIETPKVSPEPLDSSVDPLAALGLA